MTNRCRATPNTSPDSPSNGESGEVFGIALHLFDTKLLGSWVMNQPWRFCGVMHSEGRCILASNAFRRWAPFGVFMQQRVNCDLHASVGAISSCHFNHAVSNVSRTSFEWVSSQPSLQPNFYKASLLYILHFLWILMIFFSRRWERGHWHANHSFLWRQSFPHYLR